MKKALKCLSVIIVMLIILFSFSITALAQTTTQDGLQVNLTTDKQSYSLNEDIQITISVTNTNDFTVKDVSIEALLPDKFELKDSNDETSTKAIDLKSGEQANLTVVAVVKGEEQNVTNPTESTVEPNTEPNNTTEPTTKPIETNTGNTQNTKPNTQTTTSIISNNDNNKSDKSDDNTKNNNNQDNTSIKTGSDYTYMGIFIVLLLASISTLLYCLIKHFDKTTKIVSSILCVVIAVTSVVGISKFNAFAQENNSSTITVSEQIKVGNKDYTITANVKYENILNYTDDNSGYLHSNPISANVGEKTDVTFYFEISSDKMLNDKEVDFYIDDKLVGTLNNNGLNGDVVANDNIYSGTFTMFSNERKFVKCHVVYENKKSKTYSFQYYKPATDPEEEIITDFYSDIADIKSKYIINRDEYDNIKGSGLSKAEKCYNEIISYLEERSDIENYGFSGFNVMVDFNFGLTVGIPFEDLVENNSSIMPLRSINAKNSTYSGSSYKSRIVTLQPHYYELNATEFDNAAINITKSNNNYMFTENLDNQQITIETMKSLSKYGIVILDSHGGIYGSYGYIISLSEIVTEEKNEKYEASGDLWKTVIPNGNYYIITEKFFDKYYSENDFNNSIIYLGTCCGGNYNVGIRDILKKKGVEAVLTYKNTVITTYNREMITTISERLSKGDSIEDAVKKAKKKHGEHDPYIDSEKYDELGFWDRLWYNMGLIESTSINPNPAELILTGNNISFKLSDNPTNQEVIGQVIDDITKKPISNVKITYSDLNTSCITDINGRFSFDIPLSAKQCTFIFEHKDYVKRDVTLSSNGYYSFLDEIELQRKTGFVSGGIVKDSTTNNPIKDVRVEVIDNSSDSLDPVVTTTTDENGNFNLKLPYGSYSLSFHHDNYHYYGMSLDIDSEYVVLQNPVLLNPTTSENLIQNNDIVTLTGVLKTEDYEINSNNKGTVTILDLDNPIKCYLKDGNNYDGKTEYNIKSVQISSPDLKEYIGQNVTVKGKVMLAHTAHHRRDVVLLESEVIKLNSIENYKEDFINALLENEDEWYVNWGASVGYQSELTFTDLNFDGKPEFIMQYGGGSMRNNNASAYYFSNNKLFEANTWFQNNLTAYYDKSNNSYVMLGNAYAKDGVNYWWCGDFELSFDGINIISDYYSSYIAEDLNYTGNFIYTYYNGANGYGDVNGLSKITETEYNKINEEKLKNLVNINMKREFILCSDWEKYSASEKRQALEKAYDSFTYDKY